jgi:hypothetical protein
MEHRNPKECPCLKAKQHNPRRRRLALSTHHAIHPRVGQDEDIFADAMKNDDESTHKGLSVDRASAASNLATAT